jgi:hypothetical protein
MKSKYPIFDRDKLKLRPLAERSHDMDIGYVLQLDDPIGELDDPALPTVVQRLVEAKQSGSARLLMMGAHVIKMGVSRFVIELMRKGVLTHIAMNGAGAIHDYELARIGATTESVARYIRSGEFGLWNETGLLNEWAREAADLDLGFGENVGRRILESDFPHKDVSILAAAYELSIPVTVHVGIGYDIIHEHPNCDGGALGKASYRDFLIYTHTVENLEGGVMLNFGSAIMGPEVYLKALAMARNVAHPQGRSICHFTTAVFDLVPIGGDYHKELPKTDPGYYFRPHKTILVRTVADGGESFYICGDHRVALPALARAVLSEVKS